MSPMSAHACAGLRRAANWTGPSGGSTSWRHAWTGPFGTTGTTCASLSRTCASPPTISDPVRQPEAQPAGVLLGGPPEKVQFPGNPNERQEHRSDVERRRSADGLLDRQTRAAGDDLCRRAARAHRTAVRRAQFEVVRMGNVRVAAAFAGNALVYRTDDVTFTSDPYQAFIADPPAMLGNQMAAWLDRAGPFKAVTQPDSALSANYVLEVSVTELYGDFRPGRLRQRSWRCSLHLSTSARPGRQVLSSVARSPAACRSSGPRPMAWCAATAAPSPAMSKARRRPCGQEAKMT